MKKRKIIEFSIKAGLVSDVINGCYIKELLDTQQEREEMISNKTVEINTPSNKYQKAGMRCQVLDIKCQSAIFFLNDCNSQT